MDVKLLMMISNCSCIFQTNSCLRRDILSAACTLGHASCLDTARSQYASYKVQPDINRFIREFNLISIHLKYTNLKSWWRNTDQCISCFHWDAILNSLNIFKLSSYIYVASIRTYFRSYCALERWKEPRMAGRWHSTNTLPGKLPRFERKDTPISRRSPVRIIHNCSTGESPNRARGLVYWLSLILTCSQE